MCLNLQAWGSLHASLHMSKRRHSGDHGSQDHLPLRRQLLSRAATAASMRFGRVGEAYDRSLHLGSLLIGVPV